MGPGEPEHVTSYVVSPEFFDVLGVQPLMGAGLDGRTVVAPAAVLSHGLWMRRFGGDPAAIGGTLRIDGREYAIRGVMPPDFRFPSREAASGPPCRSIPPVSAARRIFWPWSAG